MLQQQILNSLRDAIFLADIETGMILDANRAAEELCGRTRAELLSLHHTDLYPPEDVGSAVTGFAAHVHTPSVGERTLLRKDGRRVPVEISSTRFTDHDGRQILIGVFRDVTNRHAAREELRKSEAYARERAAELDAIMDSVPAAILVARDPECRHVSGNRSAYTLLRQPPGTNLSILTLRREAARNIRLTVDGIEIPSSEMPIQRAISSGQPVKDCELRIAFEDAPYIDLLGNVEPMFDENRRPRGAVAVFTDITKIKGGETALRQNADILSVVLEATSEGVWDWNIQTGDAVFSPRYSTMLGYDPEEFARDYKLWKNLVHPDDIERVKQHHADYFAGRTAFSIEFRMREKSGNWHWIHSRGIVIERDPEGKPLRMVGTHSSIQERKRAEEEKERLQAQLAHAQKMETLGRLTGGIAHDFNNLMGAILLNAESALEELNSHASALSSVNLVQQAAEKAVRLTRQLLAFGGKQMLQTEILNLDLIIAESETLVRRLLGEDIRMIFLPGSGQSHVKADRGQLDQIILNVAVNSRDAMPDGGTFKIETSVVEVDEHETRSKLKAKPSRYVLLSVADTGIGMNEETQAHIFEPFFTTKDVAKGSGLGLSVVYGIVKQSDGFIRVESTPGLGTEFRIYLPVVPKKAETASDNDNVPIRRGYETILLTEDEATLREKVREILVHAGYKVLVASDGEDALRVASPYTQPIHLLLTDVVMPALSGLQLARRLRCVHPETKVLYMSGYPKSNDMISVLDSGDSFISKPFSKVKLLRRLQQVLDEDSTLQNAADRT